MIQRRNTSGMVLLAGFLIGALGVSAKIQASIDRQKSEYRDSADVLWIPSGKIVKKLSLGYDGLLADIYWTRVVQYYGAQLRDHKTDFSLLGPLLDITSDLDPNLLIVYKFGSVFLSEAPPRGAGSPERAVQLLQKGIRANPDEWRLWHHLGFIYYWNLRNYSAASAAYLEGSKNPHAAPWMKVMAAVITQKGGNRDTSRFLWAEIYRSSEDETIRKNAYQHLQALQASQDIEELERRVQQFRERTGELPKSFSELISEGLLNGVPVDPSGAPYRLAPGGRVTLAPRSQVKLEFAAAAQQ